MQVHSTKADRAYNLTEKLGEGGQGTVYKAIDNVGKSVAVKIYNERSGTSDQKKLIDELIDKGPPEAAHSCRFVWPQDSIVIHATGRFGYTMDLIDGDRFLTLGQLISNHAKTFSLHKRVIASLHVVESFRSLTLRGYCYRDINRNNILIDPGSANVLICDTDNIGVEGHTPIGVAGTFEYMAPELIRGESRYPTATTDRHSMSVFLFWLWMWHHPLHGELERKIHVLDDRARTLLYGTNPIFIFDPENTQNALPSDNDYDNCRLFWKICPDSLKEIFVKAFARGLTNPAERPGHYEWREELRALRDNLFPCNECNAELFYPSHGKDTFRCWNCGIPPTLPPRITIDTGQGEKAVTLTAETKLLRAHFQALSDPTASNTEIAIMRPHPQKTGVWGLQNIGDPPSSWVASLPGPRHFDVPFRRSAELVDGLKLTILGCNCVVSF